MPRPRGSATHASTSARPRFERMLHACAAHRCAPGQNEHMATLICPVLYVSNMGMHVVLLRINLHCAENLMQQLMHHHSSDY